MPPSSANGPYASKPWLAIYPKGVPPEIDPNRFGSIVHAMEESFKKFGPAPGFTNMGVSLTFAQLDQLTKQFASFLTEDLGLKKGDRVAIQMPNLLQYPVALFGALRAGMVVVNTNPLYTPREMEHQFLDAGVKAIVILANFANHLQEIMPKLGPKLGNPQVVVTEIGDLLGFPKSLIVNTVVKHVKKMVPSYSLPGSIRFADALARGAKHAYRPTTVTGEDLAFLQYTGGTTGVSKGAMLTHRNIIANVEQAKAWMAPLLREGEEVVITALPLYHIFSLTVNSILFMEYGGQNILITNPKDIPGFVKELKKTPFTVLTGVNTLLNALMNHPEFKDVNFSRVKLSVAGATALQSAVAERWAMVTKTRVVEGYGLTEASPIVCCNPIAGGDQAGMIGPPVPSTEMKLLDENGKEVAQGESGEICVRGPQVMKGYWQRKDETDKVLIDGWLHTGDVGVMAKDGFFKIVDRIKDMILVSGFNVYPNEVEEVLASHPGVLEVAAIGVPDEKSGEAVKVFIIKRDQALTDEQVIEFSRTKLTGYKVPKHVEFRTELPKTNVGKILRRALR